MERQVLIEDLSSVQKRIRLTIPPFEVQKKLDEIVNSMRKNVTLPGFRKGKAPTNMLVNYLSDRVKPLLSQALIGEHYGHVLAETNLTPVNSPQFETSENGYPGTFEKDNSYNVDMVVEVLPTITPVNYKDLSLSLTKNNMDDMVLAKTREYQERFAERRQVVDRPAKVGDSVVIDIQAFIDGQLIDGGSASGLAIDKLGSGSFVIQEVEANIIGMTVDQVSDLSVSFKDDFALPVLAGKNVNFSVKLCGIVEVKPADMNEDLAMMNGYTSIEEFKAAIDTEVKNVNINHEKNALDTQITAKLLETNHFDVPESMVSAEVDRLLKMLKIENATDKVRLQLRDAGVHNVKRALILNAIYDTESDCSITPDQLDGALDEQAKLHSKTRDEIASLLHSSGQMDNFMGMLKTRNVIDYIIKNSKVEYNQG